MTTTYPALRDWTLSPLASDQSADATHTRALFAAVDALSAAAQREFVQQYSADYAADGRVFVSCPRTVARLLQSEAVAAGWTVEPLPRKNLVLAMPVVHRLRDRAAAEELTR